LSRSLFLSEEKFSLTSVWTRPDRHDRRKRERESSSLLSPPVSQFDGVCSVGREGRMCIHRGVEGRRRYSRVKKERKKEPNVRGEGDANLLVPLAVIHFVCCRLQPIFGRKRRENGRTELK